MPSESAQAAPRAASPTPFGAFIKLAGRPVLVVGGGAFAEARIEKLLPTGARVHVVAPHATRNIAAWAKQSLIVWSARMLLPADVTGQWMVFASTGLHDVDRAIFRQCDQLGILCNAVDDPDFCHFYLPALVSRGDLQLAVSTNGKSPALAQQIRMQLEEQFDPSWRDRLDVVGNRRKQVLRSMPANDERREFLHQLASEAMKNAARKQPAKLECVKSLPAQRRSGNPIITAAKSLASWLRRDDDKVALI